MINNDFRVLFNLSRNGSSDDVTGRASIVTSIARYRDLFRFRVRMASSFIGTFLLNVPFNHGVNGYQRPAPCFADESEQASLLFFFFHSREYRLSRLLTYYFLRQGDQGGVRIRRVVRCLFCRIIELTGKCIIFLRGSAQCSFFLTRDDRYFCFLL